MSKNFLYTFDDLYDFFVNQNKNVNFDAEKEHSQICVQMPGKIDFSKKKSERDVEGLLPVTLRACHTKTNRNKSNIEKDVMESALNSFSNRPILGYIHEVDGKPCFWSHNMHENEDGETVYDEIPIGIISESCDAHLEYDEEAEVDRVVVNGFIFEEYSKAAEILQREEKLDVSVELNVRSLSYDAKNKYLNIEDFYFSGVTILQCDDKGNKVYPGMAGSNITLANFSQENNSYMNDINEKLETFFEKIENLFNYTNLMKGGTKDVDNENIILENAETTEDTATITESTEEEVTVTTEGEAPAEGNYAEDTTDVTPEDGQENTDTDNTDSNEDTKDETVELNSLKCSISYGENTKEFAVSLSDIQYALSELVNTTYADENSYYGVEVYMDEQYVIMQDYWTGSAYKQNYKCKKKKYSLHGDRVPVKAVYLTEDEEAKLEEMRSNYSSLVEFKSNTENAQAHAEREKVMTDEKYSVISEKNKEGEYVNESYSSLYAEMDNYSCDELHEKLKAIVGEYAINGGSMNFSSTSTSKVGSVALPITEQKAKKKSRYGNLFEGIL